MPAAPRGPSPQPPRRPSPSRGPQHPRPPIETTRAERRAAAASRSRPTQIIAAVSMLALLIAAAFFFFRGSNERDDEKKRRVSKVEIADLALTVGGVFHVNTGVPVQLPPEIQNAVIETLTNYVDGGLLAPVREGATAENIATIFDAGAAARLGGPDRAVLFDEGLPQVTTAFESVAQPVILTALSDPGGNFVLITATLNYQATAKTTAGALTSSRSSEFTLLPDGGGWKITGYDIALVREGPGAQVTTTTAAT